MGQTQATPHGTFRHSRNSALRSRWAEDEDGISQSSLNAKEGVVYKGER